MHRQHVLRPRPLTVDSEEAGGRSLLDSPPMRPSLRTDHPDRRSVVAGLAAAALPRLWPRSKEPLLKWSALGRNAWVVERGGGNATVLSAEGGAIVIDLKLGGVGYALERDVRARIGPVQAVIMSHHHADHTEGLSAFTVDRCYAHRAAAPRIARDMAQTSDAARANPTRLIDRTFADLARDFDYPRTTTSEADIRRFVSWAEGANGNARTPTGLLEGESTLRFGATELELVHAGPAHTDNDVFIVDRRRNLLITGDLLFHRHHPFIDKEAGATTTGWQRVIDRMVAAGPADATVVPGHGSVTGLAALREQSRYFEIVRGLVDRERRAGRTRKEIAAMPSTEFPGFGFADLWSQNLGVAFDETA